MKKNSYLLLLCAVMLLVVSCSKDSEEIPGPAGVQGPVGPAGPAGANGTNGSVIYSGTTVPAAATGAVGDFYINLGTGLLYGPKTASGWGTGFSLKGSAGTTGATGSAGAAGSKIYSGSGTPAATVGIAGDYYLDKTNYMLYGPKTGTGWGNPISLRGPQGDPGPQGPEGNANVKTDVFTVASTEWSTTWAYYTFWTGSLYFPSIAMRPYVRNNNSITQDVLDNGMVLVYFNPNPLSPNQWAPLPYQVPDIYSEYYTNFVYVTDVGQVTLGFYFTDITPLGSPNLFYFIVHTSYRFKVVAVTGQSGTFMKQHHVNLNNYSEVSKVLGLWQQDKVQ